MFNNELYSLYEYNSLFDGVKLKMQPVSIVGIGRTEYAPKPGIPIPEMVHQAVQMALDDAGLAMVDVDARVTASVDLWDGLTASNIAITEVIGAVMKPEARVAGDGLLAICQGAMSILAGHYQVVLVVAHCKTSMGNRWGITNWVFDPIFQQPLGLDDFLAAALQTSTLGLAAPPVSSLPADGAAAVILSAMPAPIAIHGMGWALDEHYLGDRDLTSSPALREAARRAYALAELSDPQRDLSFAEISDYFDYQRTLWASALALNSFPNLNLSGGLARGVPPFVAGLDCLIEVVLRLRRNPGMALAHGCWGPAGQGQVVVVVRR